jgi:hypothetical protein
MDEGASRQGDTLTLHLGCQAEAVKGGDGGEVYAGYTGDWRR